MPFVNVSRLKIPDPILEAKGEKGTPVGANGTGTGIGRFFASTTGKVVVIGGGAALLFLLMSGKRTPRARP